MLINKKSLVWIYIFFKSKISTSMFIDLNNMVKKKTQLKVMKQVLSEG